MAAERIDRRRGEAQRILLTVDAALLPCQAGVALCGEVIAAARRIHTAVANDSLMAAANEAGRLAQLADEYRRDFRRLAGQIDPTDDRAA